MRALARVVPAVAVVVLLGVAGCSSSGPQPTCGATAPIASAGAGQTVAKHAVVQLLASAAGASASASYRWQLVAVPSGSAAAISESTGSRASFTADVAGVYVASAAGRRGGP